MQALPVDKLTFRTVRELRHVNGLRQASAVNFHAMRVGTALERVDREIEQNLDQVGAVDFGDDVFRERTDDEFVFLGAGMDFDSRTAH